MPQLLGEIADAAYHLLDIAGVTITTVGFAITIVQLLKTRGAAEAATEAANRATSRYHRLSAYTLALQLQHELRELQRQQRKKLIDTLPDQCTSVRAKIVELRATGLVPENRAKQIERAIKVLQKIEREYDAASSDGAAIDHTAHITSINRIQDEVVRLLTELRLRGLENAER